MFYENLFRMARNKERNKNNKIKTNLQCKNIVFNPIVIYYIYYIYLCIL